ncbi:T9SS type B sorting domain-containing protein [Rasiella sp. SM2506]|uniref:T9SS type B sorting domain-containing protein n=1 Tax=Rasiella sp. SM2506 TaxID=3423914 RepID=UPI003D797C6A
MNKPTIPCIALVASMLFLCLQSYAQNYVPFTPRFDQDLKGDIVLIGNNILGPDNNPFNNNSVYNHDVDMQYIDIDGDPSTFSSSSADLVIPNPNCYEIKHASLYWGAVTKGNEPITNVKFKGPTGGYNDITGTIIFDANGTSVDGGNSFPYACYADVTSIVSGLANNLGTYTMANVSSLLGETGLNGNNTGNSAGWSLFVVYEDPTLPGKSITSFDGFSAISSIANPTLDIPISGFRTVPAPAPVRANLAFATLEGDKPILNDRLRLNGVSLSAADRPVSNFFNSSVTNLSANPVNNRVPNSTNTLGFDTGVMTVPNPGNTVIGNGDTSATVRLETGGDTYFQYLFAFAVDIIEPNIVLTKIVEDEFGTNIGGQTVNLGQELNYVIGFQNTGNDDARNFTIRDILPINIIFNYPADLVLPPGVTVQSYNATTREIVFEIEDYLVEENDPVTELRIEVQVVDTCQQLAEACSNIINNQAFATYQGTLNPTFIITDDPSYSDNTGCLLTPQATNFLADLDDCVFSQEEILCGASVDLTAANGYDSYSWSTSPTGTPVIGTTQTITVTATGTYYSFNTALAPCRSIVEQFNVTLYGSNTTNPIIPYADEVVTCPNDGKLLPNIFLCGINDFRDLTVDLAGATSIIWEQLDESSCSAVPNPDCANEDNSCNWNQVATGNNYTANTSGQFRLTINYQGGCFNQFYFNVYQNVLEPTVAATDIICTTPGSITVSNVPTGYEFSLDGITYQASNIFTVTTPGLYTVYIRQLGVPGTACVFTVPDILVRERQFTVTTNINQPLCYGDKGSIQLAANDVEPQYFFALYQGGTLINSVGPILENNYLFANLNPGTYTATVATEDGCTYSEEITIIEPPILTVTAAITQPLTCTDGEITVYPVGGTPPYFYFVNSTTVFQTTPEIVVTTAGVYNITVVDSNNCSADTTITIAATLPPEFNVTKTDILCADPGDTGSITINVTNPNGNSLRYSIDSGFNFFNAPVFTGLTAGNYNVVVEYTFGTDVCVTDPQIVTINSVTPIFGTAELTDPYSCLATGTITVTGVTGGTPPYTYSIDGINFQASPIFTGLTPGTYSVVIKDANDCTFVTNEITILPLDPPTDLTFSNTPLTCPTNTTTVTITGTTGGVAPLEYRIIAPAGAITPYQTTTTFAGLASGTYTFEVKDANECLYNESYTIDPLPALTVVGQPINDVVCFNDANGSVQFIVSGSTSFVYAINGNPPVAGTSPIVLTGLIAGTYTIVVTDTITNCQATDSVTIDGPTAALTITLDVSPISCLESGSVVLNATGGWGGNSYTLTLPDSTVLPPQSNNTFAGLTQSGTYTATVEDSNGCTVSENFDLTTPDPVVASINPISDLCYDTTNGATIEVTVTSGLAPFEYSLNGAPFQSSNIFTGLIPGTYIVTVRDALGCEVTLPAEIIAPQLSVNTVLTKDLDCTATPDAVITGTISGGSAPFSYEVSISGAPYTSLGTTGSPFTYTTGIAGTYQFQITDANGCMAESNIITVNAISLPVLDVVAQTQDILCNGDSNGAINVTFDPTVGTPPFVINVNNDTTGTDYGTQTSGLPAGTYTITLTDANSCVDTDTIVIDEPDPIVVDYDTVDLMCVPGDVSEGEITINSVTGGVAPYDYYVTGDGYSNSVLGATGTVPITFDVINFGLYQINVIDANGCSVLIQDVLIASPPSDLDIVIDTTADCLPTGGTAVVTVSSSLGSTGPFWFAIYQGPGTVYPLPAGAWQPENPPMSASTIFTNLTPGVTYTFIVYDESTRCSYYEQATTPIPTNSTLTATAFTANNITCTGNADGNVSFDINSIYAAPVDVSYVIFDALTQVDTGINGTGTVPAGGTLSVSNLGPLPFGNYYVLISETSGANIGCGIATAPFNITESTIALDLSVSVDQNANCNLDSGLISAIGQNGTAPYLYQITTVPGSPLATDPNWGVPSTFNVNAGTYYVHVLDAYGCVVSSLAEVVPLDPSPVVAITVSNPCDTDEGDFEIDVTLPTAGIPPYSFSIDSGAFQTQTPPFTIQNLSSGIHTVEVRDANGCGNIATVTIESPLGITPAVTAVPSCDDDDGEITVTATGGSGVYTYSINPNPPSIVLTGNVFSGVPSGTYTVTVTDATTTCDVDVAVTVEAATPVTFTTSTTDVGCNGNSDGVITVNLLPGNDNPVYLYEITAPIIIPPQASNIFTGLAAGTYTVQVTSGRDCIATEDASIGEPTLLTVTGTITDFACAPDNSINTATLTITEAGGTPPYLYSINGSNYFTTNTFEIVDTGLIQSISIYAKDANGCVATDVVIVDPLPVITATAFVTVTPIDCNATGSVEITVTGGSGNFTYQMLPSGAPQASPIFNIPGPGTYYFQVNDLDTNCYFLTPGLEVPPFDFMDAVIVPTVDNSCFGDTDGEIELTINGYSGNYTYQLLDGTGTPVGGIVATNTSSDPQVITNLASGNYSVAVIETDTPFCDTISNVVNIDSPSAPLLLDVLETSNVTCTDDRGTITATATGGTSPYQYELTGTATVPYSSSNTFTGLGAGSYTVNVRDAQGCITPDTIILDAPDPITAVFSPSTTLLSCFGDQNASITATLVSGGQGFNYTYTLLTLSPTTSSSGPQSSNVFTDLGAGVYQVKITDGYECEFISLDIIIDQPTEVSPALVVESTQTCLTESTLTLSATGGTGPYEYSNVSDFSSILGSFTTSISFPVPVGTYNFYVRDANGCVSNVSNDITIDPLPTLTILLDSTNPTINCVGDDNGVITATAQGGLGNYIYILQDTSGNTIPAAQPSPGVFTGLPAGTYVVYVESGDCNETSDTITITEPTTALDVRYTINNVRCNGEDNGSLFITAIGGTGIIKYAISPNLNQFFDTPVFNNLAPGNYDVIVQDALGCYTTFNFDITEPDAVDLSIVPDSIFPEICEGDVDGSFSIEISGGTPPYSVVLDNPNGEYITGAIGQINFDFNNLGGGDHTVYVRDSEGCESEWNITFPEAVLLNPLVEVEYICFDNISENRVTVTVDESTIDLSQLDYSLNGGPYQTSNVFTNLPPSKDNYILVRHTNGCIQSTDFFDIESFEPLTLVLEPGELNEIVAIANGGTGGNQFTLNDVDYGSTSIFEIAETGTYIVTVTDSSGCVAVATIYLEYIPICIPNYFTPNNDGVVDTWAPGCAEDYPNLESSIYDRYGRKVAVIRVGETWDGRYNGQELPTGDYWFVVKLNNGDNKEFVGHFTLYR